MYNFSDLNADQLQKKPYLYLDGVLTAYRVEYGRVTTLAIVKNGQVVARHAINTAPVGKFRTLGHTYEFTSYLK